MAQAMTVVPLPPFAAQQRIIWLHPQRTERYELGEAEAERIDVYRPTQP
jgi:hypothetical protein